MANCELQEVSCWALCGGVPFAPIRAGRATQKMKRNESTAQRTARVATRRV